MKTSDNLNGAIFLVLAMFCYTSGDTLVKFMTGNLNLGQIIAVRGIIAFFIVAAIIHYKKQWGGISFLKDKWVILRTIAETLATFFFFTGLSKTPIGDTAAIMQVIPLTVTLGAALFLGESVGWRRWIAILIGLLGVMIIIRPGFEGFNTYTLYIAAAVMMVTFRDLVTRRFSKQTPTLMVNLLTNLATIPLGLLMLAPSSRWQPMSNLDLAYIVLGAITIIVASQTIILAMRTAEISSIAPLRYIALPIAIAYGFFVFGDVPDIWMIIGSAIVVCMGIYTFHRERVLKQKTQAKLV